MPGGTFPLRLQDRRERDAVQRLRVMRPKPRAMRPKPLLDHVCARLKQLSEVRKVEKNSHTWTAIFTTSAGLVCDLNCSNECGDVSGVQSSQSMATIFRELHDTNDRLDGRRIALMIDFSKNRKLAHLKSGKGRRGFKPVVWAHMLVTAMTEFRRVVAAAGEAPAASVDRFLAYMAAYVGAFDFEHFSMDPGDTSAVVRRLAKPSNKPVLRSVRYEKINLMEYELLTNLHDVQ